MKHHHTGDCYPRHGVACLGGVGVPTSSVSCYRQCDIEHL